MCAYYLNNRWLIAVPLLALHIITAPIPVVADIYQQVDNDGVVCFTDTPTSANYSLLVREHRSVTLPPSSRKLPKHLAAIEASSRPATKADNQNNGGTPGKNLPVLGRVTSLSGLRNDPFDGKLRHHNGMDIACPSGTPIKAIAPGVVIFSGTRPGYGNVVVVEHPDGTITLYAHNSRNLAAIGEQVDQATVLALTGSTGRSTGPHLHFEAWNNGENITNSFLPGGAATASPGRTATEAPIKRFLQADGTLVFTNLPWK